MFLRHELTEKSNLINSFLPKNHARLFSISRKTDANKVHHQENLKHSFEVNTHNGSEDVILTKETGSSSMQQKISNTCVSGTSKIDNDNARKDHSHATKYSNNSTEQHNNETKEEHQNENKNDRKKEKSVIILGNSVVEHINGWEISKRLSHCKVHVKRFSGSKTQCTKDSLKPLLCQNRSHFILHIGNSDLKSGNSTKAIAKEIMKIVVS